MDVAQVLDWLASQGLEVHELPLRTRPHAQHWHIKKPGHTGTLEMTQDGDRLWMELRANRHGVWTEAVMESLSAEKEA